MEPIDLEFDYLPDAGEDARLAGAALGVVVELALQLAARLGDPALLELCRLRFGVALELDGPRRCRARSEPAPARFEVSSVALPDAHGPSQVHLVAEPGGAYRDADVQLPVRSDLGERRAGSSRPLAALSEDGARPRVASLTWFERGLEAELTADSEDCASFAIHPGLAVRGIALANAWIRAGQDGDEPCAPLFARRLRVLQPGACVRRMRVFEPGGSAVGVTVLAESPSGPAWLLEGLELAQPERTVALKSDIRALIPAPPSPRGELRRGLLALSGARRAAHCQRELRARIATLTGCAPADVIGALPLRDLGLSSRGATELAAELALALDHALAPSFVFDHPTLDQLVVAALAVVSGAAVTEAPRSASEQPARGCEVAVIGTGCRLPGGVSTPEQLWQLLCSGRDPIAQVTRERVALAPGMARHPLPAGLLSGVELFDAAFFATSEREAAAMDPQHRLLLEVTWEALERAGIVPGTLAGTRTGVFVSAAPFGYAHLLGELDAFTAIGNEPSAAAGRLAYFLGLRGPCMCVDAACASSLVAVCLACDSLRRGEIDPAVVGGVNLLLDPAVTESLLVGGVLSSASKRCRAFDASADGYVRSEACGVVLLRRAADAEHDGQPVQALIRGYATAHGGRSNGLGAPSREAQLDVMQLALRSAGLSAREVGYVEAHGTGTALGDALELQALAEVYGAGSGRRKSLRIGSLKTNIGHSEFAAGITGLIKTVLLAQRGELPPQLHFETPSPAIDWSRAGLAVVREREPWPEELPRRIAGVHALGLSGTYAHVLIEAPRPSGEVLADDPSGAHGRGFAPYVVALNAASEASLRALAGRYRDYLLAGGSPARLSTTSQRHRQPFPQRIAVSADDVVALQAALLRVAEGQRSSGARTGSRPKLAFLYSGFGGQYPGMGGGLVERFAVFRAAVAECERLLAGRLPCSLFELMQPDDSGAAERWLQRAAVAQPAIFALQHGLTQLWRSWGVEPDIVVGHSLGELAAAHWAGVLSLPDALWLVAERGRLMDTLPTGGAMAAVDLPRDRLQPLLDDWPDALWLAACNAPDQLVISGTGEAVDDVSARIERSGGRARRLAVPIAAHSGLLDPMLDAFERSAERVEYRPAALPIVSTLTGAQVQHEMSSAGYFRAQLRAPVEFERAMATLAAEDAALFVELGPHAVLTGPASACADAPGRSFLPSMVRDRDQPRELLAGALELYAAGIDLAWDALPGARGEHDPAVPTYAFERKRYWVHNPRSALAARDPAADVAPALPLVPVERAAEPFAAHADEGEGVSRLERLIKDELRKILEGDRAEGELEASFGELGLTSLGSVQLRSCLQRWTGAWLPMSIVARDKTARELALEAWTRMHRAA